MVTTERLQQNGYNREFCYIKRNKKIYLYISCNLCCNRSVVTIFREYIEPQLAIFSEAKPTGIDVTLRVRSIFIVFRSTTRMSKLAVYIFIYGYNRTVTTERLLCSSVVTILPFHIEWLQQRNFCCNHFTINNHFWFL